MKHLRNSADEIYISTKNYVHLARLEEWKELLKAYDNGYRAIEEREKLNEFFLNLNAKPVRKVYKFFQQQEVDLKYFAQVAAKFLKSKKGYKFAELYLKKAEPFCFIKTFDKNKDFTLKEKTEIIIKRKNFAEKIKQLKRENENLSEIKE